MDDPIGEMKVTPEIAESLMKLSEAASRAALRIELALGTAQEARAVGPDGKTQTVYIRNVRKLDDGEPPSEEDATEASGADDDDDGDYPDDDYDDGYYQRTIKYLEGENITLRSKIRTLEDDASYLKQRCYALMIERIDDGLSLFTRGQDVLFWDGSVLKAGTIVGLKEGKYMVATEEKPGIVIPLHPAYIQVSSNKTAK